MAPQTPGRMRSAKEAKMGTTGRPRTENPRFQQIKLNLTHEEFADIQRRARTLGLRPVHFIRRSIFSGTSDGAVDVLENPTDRLVLDQLKRLGNNLNQLIRLSYLSGDTLPPDLEPLLIDIRNIIAKARR